MRLKLHALVLLILLASTAMAVGLGLSLQQQSQGECEWTRRVAAELTDIQLNWQQHDHLLFREQVLWKASLLPRLKTLQRFANQKPRRWIDWSSVSRTRAYDGFLDLNLDQDSQKVMLQIAAMLQQGTQVEGCWQPQETTAGSEESSRVSPVGSFSLLDRGLQLAFASDREVFCHAQRLYQSHVALEKPLLTRCAGGRQRAPAAACQPPALKARQQEREQLKSILTLNQEKLEQQWPKSLQYIHCL